MCPMCEKRAQLLLQQQTVVESTVIPTSRNSDYYSNKPGSLFRNPFKACKHLTRQCCSPLCESQRTSIASGRRSSAIAPVPSTPEHSGELTYIVSESPLSADESKDGPPLVTQFKARKRKGLLTRLRALVRDDDDDDEEENDPPSSTESSFGACGRKVMAVADEIERNDKSRDGVEMPSVATLLVAETDLDDSMSEVSVAVTETNVSETTILSMMNLNGSFSCSPYEVTNSNRGSTLKSSAYDDDASSFAVIPRTSMNSSYLQRDGASDASGLSDRFGELDIGYLSLEESGEGPEFDDTVSISSDHQSAHLDLDAQDDTVSESDFDQEYSISSTEDSQEWVTETEDAASILQRSRTHHNRDNNNKVHNHHPNIIPVPPLAPPLDQENRAPNPVTVTKTNVKKEFAVPPPLKQTPKTTARPPPPPPESTCTEYLCSRCGRKEPRNSPYLEEQAVMAAKVVVLLGKYGNRKGLRVSGLQSNPQTQVQSTGLSAKELERLRSMICPTNDAVSAFQNEVARMMMEGVDVPDLNVDVEQFIAGYMKLNSPFYIDLIQDFFKSVCIDCFGHMESVRGPRRPAYAMLKSTRKTKSVAGKGGKLLQ